MRMRTRMGLGLSVMMLAGATVWAQRPSSALPNDPPATKSERRVTFDDLFQGMKGILQERGSLEVKTHGEIEARVRIESSEALERARPLLEQMDKLAPLSMGWINREEEVKAELTEALGKVPDVLTVSQELRLRDMEGKLEKILKALGSQKRVEGQ